jgi:GGDEF domain-containing protein
VVLLGAPTPHAQLIDVAERMLGGITRCPQDGHSVSELLATADHAMYAVKAEGGGFRFASPPTV